MMVVCVYKADNKEYMVMDGTQGFLPEAAAVRLLMHRRHGVGADRLLVFRGSEEVPSFVAFTPEGEQQELTSADYAVLSRSREDYEIHLTDHFLGRLRAAAASRAVCAG